MEYIKDVEVGVDTQEQPPIIEVSLFGKEALVYDDDYRTHLHIITTHKCNASCSFCIEKDSCRRGDDVQKVLHTAKVALREMNEAGILKSVSITGGEPLLFPALGELVEMINEYDVFLTMNTNGLILDEQPLWLLDSFDWINISRHHCDTIENNKVFGWKRGPCIFGTMKLRSMLKHCKLRFQCVVDRDTKLTDFIPFVVKGAVDDLSFRMRMIEDAGKSDEDEDSRKRYRSMIKNLRNHGAVCISQEIQDYYVYEIHEYAGISFTFSYSNMGEAFYGDAVEHPNFHREFIIKPNGVLSSSWQEGVKVIYEPNEY